MGHTNTIKFTMIAMVLSACMLQPTTAKKVPCPRCHGDSRERSTCGRCGTTGWIGGEINNNYPRRQPKHVKASTEDSVNSSTESACLPQPTTAKRKRCKPCNNTGELPTPDDSREPSTPCPYCGATGWIGGLNIPSYPTRVSSPEDHVNASIESNINAYDVPPNNPSTGGWSRRRLAKRLDPTW